MSRSHASAVRPYRAAKIVGGATLAVLASSGCSSSQATGAKTAAPAMKQWIISGYALLAPADWTESKASSGGSSAVYTLTSKSGLEFAKATVDYCTGCIISIQNGIQPIPNLLPYLTSQAGAGATIVNSHTATYSFPRASGVVGRGIVFIRQNNTSAIQVKVTASASDLPLASEIVASVEEAPGS